MEKRIFRAQPHFLTKRKNSLEESNILPGSVSSPEAQTPQGISKTNCDEVEDSPQKDDGICLQPNFFQHQVNLNAIFPKKSQSSSSPSVPRFPLTPRRAETKNLVARTGESISHLSPDVNQRQFMPPPFTPSRFVGRPLLSSPRVTSGFPFTPTRKTQIQNSAGEVSTEKSTNRLFTHMDDSQTQQTAPPTTPIFPFTPKRKTQIQNSEAEVNTEKSTNRLFSHSDESHTQQTAPPTTPSRFVSASRFPFSSAARSGFSFTPKRTPTLNSNAEVATRSQLATYYPSHDDTQNEAGTQLSFHENDFAQNVSGIDQPEIREQPCENSEMLNYESFDEFNEVDDGEPIETSGRNKEDCGTMDLYHDVAPLVPSMQGKISAESHNPPVNQFLMATDKARAALVAENENLKIRLEVSGKKIVLLEEQVDKMTSDQLEVTDKADCLLAERETLRNEMKVLQDQIATTEDQVKEKKHQYEEANSLLQETEERLKMAMESVSSLEELLRSSDEKLEALQTQLQQSSTEHTIATEKGDKLSEEVKNLHEELISLQSKMSEAENRFRSTIFESEDRLSKEVAAHGITASALNDARSNLETSKEELARLITELEKMEVSFKAIAEEKDNLEERYNKLHDQYSICEKSLNVALENVASLEVSFNTVHEQLQPLKQQLETAATELSHTGEKAVNLQEENEFLKLQLEQMRAHMKESENKFRCTQKQLDCERVANDETKLNLKVSRDRLVEEQKQRAIEQSRFHSMLEMTNEQKKNLDAEVSELKAKLASSARSNESMREENSSLERQAELFTIELSTLRVEALEQSNRNSELKIMLDDIRMKSALSEDYLRADLSQSRKELDSQREIHQDTLRQLTDTQVKLCATKSACNEAILDQNKIQAEIINLRNIKLENEKMLKQFEKEMNDQEKDLDKAKANNLSLNQTLSGCEEFLKFTLQNYKLMSTEYSETIENVKGLVVEINSLRSKLDTTKKNAEIAHEDVHDLHISLAKFIETKQMFQAEIQKNFSIAHSKLLSSNETLKQTYVEKFQLENTNRALLTEKEDLQKQILTLDERMKGYLLDAKSTQQQIEKAENGLEFARSEIISLNEAIKKTRTEKAHLENTNREMKSKTEELDKDLGELKRHLQSSEHAQEKLRNRNTSLTDIVTSSNRQISNLKTQTKSLESDVISAKQENQDLLKKKENLELQLETLHQRFQVSEDKFNRELNGLRRQLELTGTSQNSKFQKDNNFVHPENFNKNASERDPPKPYKANREVGMSSDPKQTNVRSENIMEAAYSNVSLQSTPSRTLPCVVDQNRQMFASQNKNHAVGKANNKEQSSSSQQFLQPPTPIVTSQANFQKQPLRDYRQELNAEKEGNKSNRDNSESTNLTRSDKTKKVENLAVGKVPATVEKGVTDNLKSIPSVASTLNDKMQTRQKTAGSVSFPIKLESDESSNDGPQATAKVTKVTTGRERKRLYLASSQSIATFSPKQESESPKSAPLKRSKVVDFDDPIETFSSKSFTPVRKTYGPSSRPKRVSVTSLVAKAPTPKKVRGSTN